ncbi:U8 snoRNA-decapping enzyme-like [Uloborus diversus]|uniref:U8 snoRNA-decapping enzyme-like n=1 Tax=Uloborus diversus TaxID=327109 RepID=UPI002409D175|nr:U8 snoRNA-decapping enzyme-like [Uloborus diversus]
MDHLSMIKSENNYTQISFQESLEDKGFLHAVHCCIYSLMKSESVGNNVSRALVQMILRSDGRFGFPGGKVDEGEDVLTALNRELIEEINLNSKYFFTQANYLFTHRVVGKSMYLHFYAKEVLPEDLLKIEKDILNGSAYGQEILGLFRVPTYTEEDNYKGFPAFLSNNFAANSKLQLLNFLLHAKVLCGEEIDKAISSSKDTYFNFI